MSLFGLTEMPREAYLHHGVLNVGLASTPALDNRRREACVLDLRKVVRRVSRVFNSVATVSILSEKASPWLRSVETTLPQACLPLHLRRQHVSEVQPWTHLRERGRYDCCRHQ